MDSIHRTLLFLVLIGFSLTISSDDAYGQGYSKIGIWTESGVWIGSHLGVTIPVGRLMTNYHDDGYSVFVSLEFPKAFYDIGLEGGIQRFYATKQYGVADMIPVNGYFRFTIIKFGFQSDYRTISVKTGAGGGIYINKSKTDLKYFLGIYVPVIFRYRFTKQFRVDFEVRGYEVFGDIATDSGTDDYIDIQLSFHYFIPDGR